MNDKLIYMLRVGVAFSFLYASISGFLEPTSWVGFLPQFATKIMAGETILMIFGVVEILVALGLLFMKNPFYLAVLSALMLLGIVVFNIPQMDILFRDIPIVLMAVAIALYYRKVESL
jgi:uncharacterized membrane protein